MTPLCYAYLAGSLVLFAIWLVFFLLRKDLRQEMLTMSVLIGVLSVVTGYVWWTVDWWKPHTITRTIVGVRKRSQTISKSSSSANFVRAEVYRVKSRLAEVIVAPRPGVVTTILFPGAIPLGPCFGLPLSVRS